LEFIKTHYPEAALCPPYIRALLALLSFSPNSPENFALIIAIKNLI